MKTIFAATALALTLAAPAALADSTVHVIKFQNGSILELVVDASCQTSMKKPPGRKLYKAFELTNNPPTKLGCWYTSSDGRWYEVNVPGETGGWQKYPVTNFVTQTFYN